jgi:hypothetical protein
LGGRAAKKSLYDLSMSALRGARGGKAALKIFQKTAGLS